MKIVVMGLNHKTAPLEMREKLAFPERELGGALKRLLDHQHIREGVILSTCNRVEIYTVVDELEKGKAALKGFLEGHHQIKFAEIEDKLYIYTEPEAVSHLFRVAASLDSLVVGEAQILGQVKVAYSWAHENTGTGKILNSLFQRAFRVAKEVRTDTDIAKSPTSVSSFRQGGFNPGGRRDERNYRSLSLLCRGDLGSRFQPYFLPSGGTGR